MRWKQYVEQVAKIRFLSSPALNDTMNGTDYFDSLNRNFNIIRRLADSNRTILREDINPYLENTEELLPDEIVEEFRQMNESLVDAFNMENIDMTMTSQIADRLYIDAVAKGDVSYIIEQLDLRFEAYYTLMNMTKRISEHSDLCEVYRKKAKSVAAELMRYFEKEEFAKLPDEDTRETLLVNSRYISLLHEGRYDEEGKKGEWEILAAALLLENDSFYREQAPNYDWLYHRMRTLEYFAFLPELHNRKNLNQEECGIVADYCRELFEMWTEHDELKEYIGESEILFFISRAGYFAGRISLSEYKNELLKLYDRRNRNEYEIGEILQNILIPVEYIMAIRTDRIKEEELFRLDAIYKNIINYVACMPNTGCLCYLLEYFSEFMSCYIEILGQGDYLDVCVEAMAALHPPTYVHTNMVGRVSKCMCRHLLNLHPEMFVGVLGYDSVEKVLENRELIEKHIFKGALAHDVGKIWIIDTIFVYGRNLTDDEFSLVKTHPVVGSAMLKKYDSCAEYSDMALGHHKWSDNTKGYPFSFDTSSSGEKLLIDLLACADCLDAATDSVGRSYNTKKTIDEVLEELKNESGTRYTAAIKELLENPAVVKDLKYLLTEGRKQMYYHTFRQLLAVKSAATNR